MNDIDGERKRDLFVIIILSVDSDELNYADSLICEKLSGFTENEWIFNNYQKFYSKFLSNTTNCVMRYNNVTTREMYSLVNKEFNIILNDDNHIYSDIIKLIDADIYFNNFIIDEVYQTDTDYDILYNTFIPSLYMLNNLLNEDGKLYFKDDFDIISKLLTKVCGIYLPFLCICDDSYSYDLFRKMSDEDKVMITKIVNFPKPLEEYEYYDIICNNYKLIYYLREFSIIFNDS